MITLPTELDSSDIDFSKYVALSDEFLYAANSTRHYGFMIMETFVVKAFD